MWVQPLDQEDPLEEGTTTHSSVLAWRSPWTEKPGRLQSIGSQRAGHDWSNVARMHTFGFLSKAPYPMVLSYPLSSFPHCWASLCGSDGKESACDAGDPGSSPDLERFPWWREWQCTPGCLPREFHGQWNLVSYSPWGHKELDTTEWLIF